MLYGLIWGGPGGHYWQKFMEVLFKGKVTGQELEFRVGNQGWAPGVWVEGLSFLRLPTQETCGLTKPDAARLVQPAWAASTSPSGVVHIRMCISVRLDTCTCTHMCPDTLGARI